MIDKGYVTRCPRKVPKLQLFVVNAGIDAYADVIAVEVIVAGDIIEARLNRLERLADGFASSDIQRIRTGCLIDIKRFGGLHPNRNADALK